MFHRRDVSVGEPAGIVDEVFIREVESKGDIFVIAGLLIRLIIIFVTSAQLIKKRHSRNDLDYMALINLSTWLIPWNVCARVFSLRTSSSAPISSPI